MTPIHERPAELLQQLLRFDTTNPPGNEAACVRHIADLLAAQGIESQLFARDDARPNLLARLPGAGQAPPLLLYGHVDVVTTVDQHWTHPPFSGAIADGFVWGRGTLDMKGGVAMMIAAFMRAHAQGITPPGDVLLLVVADEEAGGRYGAGFMIQEHPELFAGVRYAIGELGGYTSYLNGHKYYPVQIAEKSGCGTMAIFRGPGGHGSMPLRGGAMAGLGRALQILDRSRLPVHITPGVRLMIEALAEPLPADEREQLLRLLDPAQTDAVLDQLGDFGRWLEPLLHNTFNATIVEGGHKSNVVPAEVRLRLDIRILPGQNCAGVHAELRALLGPDVELELQRMGGKGVSPENPDMGLFATLADILRQADPDALPVPAIMPAGTDGRWFSELGIQTYGYLPMNLPPEIEFMNSLHAADERIPVASMNFGTDVMFSLLQRFGEAQ